MVTSETAYLVLIAATACERLVEMVLSKRNARWSFDQGGVEHGRGHFPFMVALHTAFLFGCALEVWALDRPFLPRLGWPALTLAIGCQGLRWWCIATLGRRWNTRVIVVPGLEPIRRGPYQWLAHPNYVAVVTEGLALPLVHTAWITAIAFTVLNAMLLRTRIRCENAALQSAQSRGRGAV